MMPIPPPSLPGQEGAAAKSMGAERPGRDEDTPAEETPWGPVRLKFRGKYVPPVVATLAFLSLLTAVFVVGAVLWRSSGKLSTEASLAEADGSRDASFPSTARPAKGSSQVARNAPTYETSIPKVPKPSAATPGDAQPGPVLDHPLPQALISAGKQTPVQPPFDSKPTTFRAPTISTFSSSAQAVDPGASATLSWAVAGEAQKIIISPEPGLVGAAGQVMVHPTQSTQYVITATGPGGSVSDQVFIQVHAVAAPSVDFGADTTHLKPGSTATLHWTVSGADQVTIDPEVGPVEPTGTVKVKPTGTTQYTLLARGHGGTTGRAIQLEVSGYAGPGSGQLIWSGVVSGTQLVTIDHNHADTGTLLGALPGMPCILQPADLRKVGIASAPSEENGFDRLVLRVIGHGHMTVIVKWSLL